MTRARDADTTAAVETLAREVLLVLVGMPEGDVVDTRTTEQWAGDIVEVAFKTALTFYETRNRLRAVSHAPQP